jgi:hypothetical protein
MWCESDVDSEELERSVKSTYNSLTFFKTQKYTCIRLVWGEHYTPKLKKPLLLQSGVHTI